MYEISGKVKLVNDLQTFDSGFKKREFVVTTQEQYPQDVKLECVQERCSLLDGIQAGDAVKAKFNIRGNEYNGRYYVNLQAWAIEKGQAQEEGAPPPLASEESLPPADKEFDDLPF